MLTYHMLVEYTNKRTNEQTIESKPKIYEQRTFSSIIDTSISGRMSYFWLDLIVYTSKNQGRSVFKIKFTRSRNMEGVGVLDRKSVV